MSTHAGFKKIVQDRLETVDILVDKEEWGMAAYLLGFVLECVLKAGACKALNLSIYPEPKTSRNNNIVSYFRTHNFEMLLVISGASDIFGFSGLGSSSWSGFLQEYQGSQWTELRYDEIEGFDEPRVKRIYDFLTKAPDGIIPLMDKGNKW